HIEELIAVDADGDAVPVIDIPAQADAGQDFTVFDASADEPAPASEYAIGVEGLEFDASSLGSTSFETLAFEPASFDGSDFDTGDALPAVTGPDFS
ncbi:hypothetical protein ACUOHE_23875, partial [Escherichia coli]